MHMDSYFVIAYVGYVALGFPLGYPTYRIRARRKGPPASLLRASGNVLSDIAWFMAELLAGSALGEWIWRKVFHSPVASWKVFWAMCSYLLVIAAVMTLIEASLGRMTGVTRRSFWRLVLVACLSFASQGLMTRFVVSVYYLDDIGLARRHKLDNVRIGSSVGPSVGFTSNLGYYILRPVRGAVVTAVAEGADRLPAQWQTTVPEHFHYRGGASGTEDYLGRVIAMPGETVVISRGMVTINGTPLLEPYVENYVAEPGQTSLRLGREDYLLGEDVRKDWTGIGNAFYVVHESQVRCRQFLLLWPLRDFGLVQPPLYNIPNPPVWNVHVSEKWLSRFAAM